MDGWMIRLDRWAPTVGSRSPGSWMRANSSLRKETMLFRVSSLSLAEEEDCVEQCFLARDSELWRCAVSTHYHNNRRLQSSHHERTSEYAGLFFWPCQPTYLCFDIQEWIHSHLQVAEHSVLLIQIDGLRRQVFIKFTDPSYVHYILHVTHGTTVYKHTSGKISTVRLEIAGLGTHRIRLTSLHPEVPSTAISTALAPFFSLSLSFIYTLGLI